MSRVRPIFNGRAAFATTAVDEAGIPLFVASMLEPTEIIVGIWRPSLMWIALHSMRGVAVIVAITLLAAASAEWAKQPWSTSIAQLGAFLILTRVGIAGAEWASRIYVLTDRRVLRRRGVLSPTVFSASLINLRRVELLQTNIDRSLQTGTITFRTQVKGHYDAAWVMIPHAAEVLAVIEETRRRYGR